MSGLDQRNSSFKSGLQKIKTFLLRQQWKEVLIFLAFVLLAFGFWLLQSMQEEYEIEVNIPVKYKNMPVDLAFNETAPDKVTVKLKDKGSVLMNYTFGRKFVPIEKSFKEKEQQSTNGILTIPTKEIESEIQKQLIATTKLVKFEPALIKVSYGKRAHKAIPVVFDGKINLDPGFQLSGEILISPAVVNVYGTEVALDSIQQISTIFTEFKSVNKTITRNVQLRKNTNLSYEKEAVTITIPVDEYSEKTLDIPVECTNIPSNYTVRLMPHTVKVSCNIPISRFKELTEKQFAVKIPFSTLEQNLTGVVDVELTQKPAWVSSASLTPNKIEFVIEQNR